MVRALIVLTIAACNYSPQAAAPGGDSDGPAGDGGPPDTGDAPPDSFVGPPPTPCVTRWLTDDLDFANPAFLRQGGDNLATTADERDPFLSSTELELYYTKAGSGGDLDVIVATRSSLASPFGSLGSTSTSLSDSNLGDGKVTMTADDLTAIVSSLRAEGEGNFDFWQATRTAAGTQAFPTLTQTFLAEVNDNDQQQDPYLSGDGLRLYYAASSPQKLVVASRVAQLASFGAPVDIPVINDGDGSADPTLSGDERVILFTSSRAGGDGLTDLWYATRDERDQPFGTPVNVPQVNGSDDDGDAHLSADGCRLYFASTRGVGDYDVLFTQLQ